MLRVDWTIQAGQIELALTIPVDTHAVVHVPGADHELGSGAYSFIVNELN